MLMVVGKEISNDKPVVGFI